MLFIEVPLLERPGAAAAAGFQAIEFWWPWPDQPVPAERDVDEFVDAVRAADVSLIGLNFFAGDVAFWVGDVPALATSGDDMRFGVTLVEAAGNSVSGDPVLESER